MRIGAQSAFIDNTLQSKGANPFESEKATKQDKFEAQRTQQEQIEQKKLTIPQDIEFKLQQKQLLQEQQKHPVRDNKSGNQQHLLNNQSKNQQSLSSNTTVSTVLVNDDLPHSKKAISAYEATATLEKRQEIAELVGFDGFA
jgi:hypothetical protein